MLSSAHTIGVFTEEDHDLHAVSIQSMLSSDVRDYRQCVQEVQKLLDANCSIVRIAVPTLNEVKCFKKVVDRFKESGRAIEFVADIHYSREVAVAAAEVADKVRINPANYLSRKEWSYPAEIKKEILLRNLSELVEACNSSRTRIRVGVNAGSVYRGRKQAKALEEMVEEALLFSQALQELSFQDFVISIKSSDVSDMIRANHLLKKKLEVRNWKIPIHLGVTEAGRGMLARAKSAYGIGTCLSLGIGQTIRVSLAENSWHEMDAARKIIEAADFIRREGLLGFLSTEYQESGIDKEIQIIHQLQFNREDTSPFLGDYILHEDSIHGFELFGINDLQGMQEDDRGLPKLVKLNSESDDLSYYILAILLPHLIRAGKVDGLFLSSRNKEEAQTKVNLAKALLQASGNRQLKSDVVACPSCGRTAIDIHELSHQTEKEFGDRKKKISIMGCAVNGFGEMLQADIGIVGAAPGKADIYANREKVRSAVAEEHIIETIRGLLDEC